MLDVTTLTLVVAGLLMVVAAIQPVAAKFRLPPTVLLAGVGVGLGFLAAFLLATPLTDAFNDVVEPLVTLPVRSPVFLYVFLPLLLFQASITLEVRRLLEDIVPILVLAVLAVVLAAAVIGFSLDWLFGVPLVAALLLGAIVATTDPAAVVAIFRDIGAPARLTRLVEGESLLNDAAAIALFSLLLTVIIADAPLDLGEAASRFAVSFVGGAVAGYVGGRATVLAAPLMRGLRAAEVTLTVSAAYIIYIVCDAYLGVSGVVAVVVAGLTVGAAIPARIAPGNWRHLCAVWEQVGFWAGSLVFLLAAILVPRFLTDMTLAEIGMILTVVVAALAARALVLFGVLPLLGMLRLAQHVSLPYGATILWGGLRGAVTLALALAVTENRALPAEVKEFVAVTATGFVLFTLFVNGLTLRKVIHWLKLDRLSPVDQAVRNQVFALALTDVVDRVRQTARDYDIEPKVMREVARGYHARIQEAAADDIEQVLTDRERLTLGLIALAAREKELILAHHGRRTLALDAVGPMLRHAERLIEMARTEGRTGYNRAARRTLRFGPEFRVAYALHRWLHIDRLLRRRLAQRFETLLVLSLLLTELQAYVPTRIAPLLGPRIGEILKEMLQGRLSATRTALEALRLQYPGYAEALEREILTQIGEQQELSHYDELRDEGLLGPEVHESLRRAVLLRDPIAPREARLDITRDPVEMVRSLPLFAHLDEARTKELAKLLRPVFVLPGRTIVKRGDTRLSLYFVASGAVEVRRPERSVRLGPGDFFGEMALLTGQPRSADVTALTFCHLLSLSAENFRRFLEHYPRVREEIEKTAARRAEENAGGG